MDTQIEVRKLTPTIGAEVFGIDLGAPLSNQQLDAIHRVLLDNLVIFFRDQALSPDQHEAFARHFGKLSVHPAIPPELPEHPEILTIKSDENTKSVGEAWHTDVSCDLEPPMGSVLYMHELPANGGGDTMFANMYAAYDELSDAMKCFLEGLTAVHDGGPTFRGLDHVGSQRKNEKMPLAEHPVIRTHPETGRKSLFVNSVFTKKIVQLTPEESDSVLQLLYRHVGKSHFHCRFKWQSKSIAFWDNRCTQHQAIWDYQGFRRYAHRATISGDRPFYRA